MSWAQTVRVLADALVTSTDDDALAQVLPAGTSIRRFDRLDPEDRLSLQKLTRGAVVVAALAYGATPTTLASDLNRHLRGADFIPEAVRSEFILEDEKTAKVADAIAAQWVSTTLQPGVEQPVAALVFWQQHASQNPADPPDGQIVFILVKSHQNIARQFRISQLIYGDTSQIVR
jgi:hypothetical protein